MTGPRQFLDAQIDPRDFGRLMRGIRGFDKSLSTALRKRLRAAAKPAVDEVKATLLAAPSKGGSKDHLRRTLADGTKVSITTGKDAGITIVTSGAKLPAPRLAKAYNKQAFKHPVFGNREVWVTEPGHPYFGRVYRHRPQMRQAALQALADAVKSMEHS